MTTCTEGDSFRLNAEDASFDGCYSDAGDTQNDEIEYFRGGDKVDGEAAVIATEAYGSTVTWVLCEYDADETHFHHQCRDADENDASVVHPTDVTQWDCKDDLGDFTQLDAIETGCDCPGTTPTSCSSGDSFYLAADYTWDELESYDGCYSDSGDTISGEVVYFRGGDKVDGEAAVVANPNIGTTVTWALSHYDEAEGEYEHRCRDSGYNNASLIHPTEVILWDCEDDFGDLTRLHGVDTSCGCLASPAPSLLATPAPTPIPTALEPTLAPLSPTPAPLVSTREILAPTPAPPTPTPTPLTPAPHTLEPTPILRTTLTPAHFTLSPVDVGLAPATGGGDTGLSAGAIGGIVGGGMAALLAIFGGFQLACKFRANDNNQCQCCVYQRRG